MSESKAYLDRLATPNSSKLAQILLELKDVDPSADSSAESADRMSETSQMMVRSLFQVNHRLSDSLDVGLHRIQIV